MLYLVNLKKADRCIIIGETGIDRTSEIHPDWPQPLRDPDELKPATEPTRDPDELKPAREPDAAELKLPVPEPIPDEPKSSNPPEPVF